MLTRRRLLQAGTLGLLGLDLPRLLRAETSRGSGSIRSCILLYYYGGPSHLDTWDMKPNAPKEVRGEFQSIATKVPGIRICEHMPRSSRIVEKLAIVRSVHHPMRNHNAAAVEALCGRTPLGGDQELLNDDANSFPCYGAALNFLNPGRHNVPTHVALPQPMYNVVRLPGQTAGFLGAKHNPFQVNGDLTRSDFRVHELTLPADLSPARMDDRRELLSIVESQTRGVERRLAGRGLAVHQDRAFDILASDEVRRAFDLSRESQRTRDRYGRDTLGQSLLLARRLVEGGVRFVNVNDKFNNGQAANWDSHENNFGRLKNDLLPPSDLAFSALIEDLDARGLLETTLVVALAEFGRTPKINGNKGGRDHWPDCFSVVMAGGGIKGGMVHGASDRIGAYPALDPVSSGDLAATLFWRFGLDTETEIKDLTGRPYRLADGEPLRGLFA
ncbi:MAG: DUF1501 domain-containing protein [Gemmataceae bacterium]|nr:DUF1501 domain-containing protein [Gemmataceae bacterium]